MLTEISASTSTTPTPDPSPSPASTDTNAESPAEGSPSAPQHVVPSRSTSCPDGVKPKRKRARVSAEQLVHLEAIFVVDKCPTAARRKEICAQLGMTERQTQIWFQNRRAKAKLQARQKAFAAPEASTSEATDICPELDMHDRIHEAGPVMFIPCTELVIGSWKRIATTAGKHDLLAYVHDTTGIRCMSWFVHCAGTGFKMDIPLYSIVGMNVTSADRGVARVVFTLSRPPLFFTDASPPSASSETPRKQWRRCPDWTEDAQATAVLQHVVTGPHLDLTAALQKFNLLDPGGTSMTHSTPPPPPLRRPQYQNSAVISMAPLPTMHQNSILYQPLSYEGPSSLLAPPESATASLQHLAAEYTSHPSTSYSSYHVGAGTTSAPPSFASPLPVRAGGPLDWINNVKSPTQSARRVSPFPGPSSALPSLSPRDFEQQSDTATGITSAYGSAGGRAGLPISPPMYPPSSNGVTTGPETPPWDTSFLSPPPAPGSGRSPQTQVSSSQNVPAGLPMTFYGGVQSDSAPWIFYR